MLDFWWTVQVFGTSHGIWSLDCFEGQDHSNANQIQRFRWKHLRSLPFKQPQVKISGAISNNLVFLKELIRFQEIILVIPIFRINPDKVTLIQSEIRSYSCYIAIAGCLWITCCYADTVAPGILVICTIMEKISRIQTTQAICTWEMKTHGSESRTFYSSYVPIRTWRSNEHSFQEIKMLHGHFAEFQINKL